MLKNNLLFFVLLGIFGILILILLVLKYYKFVLLKKGNAQKSTIENFDLSDALGTGALGMAIGAANANSEATPTMMNIPTPISAAYNIDLDNAPDPAYQGGVFLQLPYDSVAHVKNILKAQQEQRRFIYSTLVKIEDDTNKEVIASELQLAVAIKNEVYAVANVASIDPAVIARSTPAVAWTTFELARAVQHLDEAKKTHEKALNNLRAIKDLFTMAIEAEAKGKEFLAYSETADRLNKQDCFRN